MLPKCFKVQDAVVRGHSAPRLFEAHLTGLAPSSPGQRSSLSRTTALALFNRLFYRVLDRTMCIYWGVAWCLVERSRSCDAGARIESPPSSGESRAVSSRPGGLFASCQANYFCATHDFRLQSTRTTLTSAIWMPR